MPYSRTSIEFPALLPRLRGGDSPRRIKQGKTVDVHDMYTLQGMLSCKLAREKILHLNSVFYYCISEYFLIWRTSSKWTTFLCKSVRTHSAHSAHSTLQSPICKRGLVVRCQFSEIEAFKVHFYIEVFVKNPVKENLFFFASVKNILAFESLLGLGRLPLLWQFLIEFPR